MVALKLFWYLSLTLLNIPKSEGSRIIYQNVPRAYEYPDCGEDLTLNEENVCVPIIYDFVREEIEKCAQVPREACRPIFEQVPRQICEKNCKTVYEEVERMVCETIYDTKCEPAFEMTSVPMNCGKDKIINDRNECVSKSKAIEPQSSPDYDFGDYNYAPPAEDSYGAAAAPPSCGYDETLDNQNNCVPIAKAIVSQVSSDYDFGDYSDDFSGPPTIPSTTPQPQAQPEETYSLRSMINRFFGLPF